MGLAIIMGAYCIRPLYNRLNRTANRCHNIANGAIQGVCNSPYGGSIRWVVAYGVYMWQGRCE